MQQEDPRTETELLAEEESEEESETVTPPIDEDVAGSVNAAVPDTADD